MCWTEWINPSVVDQDIDMPISDLDRFSCHFTRARGVSQVRRNKIRFAYRSLKLRNCFLPALSIPADDDDVDAKLSEFVGCSPADPARPSGNECSQ
jgi:hypothetical protein